VVTGQGTKGGKMLANGMAIAVKLGPARGVRVMARQDKL
jgi:hypothetical protein